MENNTAYYMHPEWMEEEGKNKSAIVEEKVIESLENYCGESELHKETGPRIDVVIEKGCEYPETGKDSRRDLIEVKGTNASELSVSVTGASGEDL